jgi:hypothetical protein
MVLILFSSNMRAYFILLALCISGCQMSLKPISNNTELNELSIWNDFSIQVDRPFKEKITRDDGSLAFTTYSTKSTNRLPHDYSIYLFSNKVSNCSKETIGISKIKYKEEDNVIWGRVDAWDGQGIEGWEPSMDLSKVVCKPSATVTFALCAEKNGKTVVVCINQMTDNPDQAKQIFETFRWTE